jgi:hypothetical protein
MYIAGALSALGEMLPSFYREIEEPERISEVLRLTGDMVLNFDEIYALDIVWHAYRRCYEKCLRQFQVEQDYEKLMKKVDRIRMEAETASRMSTEERLRTIELGAFVLAVLIFMTEVTSHHNMERFFFHTRIGLAVVAAGSLLLFLVLLRMLWRLTAMWWSRMWAIGYVNWWSSLDTLWRGPLRSLIGAFRRVFPTTNWSVAKHPARQIYPGRREPKEVKVS